MALLPGTRLGPYEIRSAAGAGGMGEVYRARDTRLDRIVAIKVLPPALAADPQFRERFDREARAISQLTHSSICTLYDVGEHEGTAFLVMELLDGQTLAGRLASTAIPRAEALKVAIEIASALDAAHRAQIVHRDLKPGNVMLTAAGAKLLDFGLATTQVSVRSLDGSMAATTPAPITAEGTILGTFQYMAPEQLKGLHATEKSDIWAFGCVLHEMLTGQDVRARIPVTPRRLNRLLDTCLSSNPAARPSAAELVRELRAIEQRAAWRAPIRKAAMPAAALLLLIAAALGGRLLLTRAPVPNAPVTILIADFDNQTSEAVFDRTVEHGITLALEDSRFVSMYPRQDALASASLIESGARLDERMSRLVARREGIPLVVAGVIAAERAGYVISAHLVDPQPGVIVATATERFADRAKALEAIGHIGQQLRRALGERNVTTDSLPSDETFTTSSLDAAREYVIAQDLHVAGRSDEAAAHYQEAIKHDPRLGRAYSGWAICELELGKLEEARRLMANAMELLPRMNRREQLRTDGVNAIALLRDYRHAADVFETLLREYPADPTAQNNFALAKFMVLDFQGAKASGTALVRALPNKHIYRSNLALYGMYSGDFETAVREAKQAIAINPKSPLQYLPLGVDAAYRGDLADTRRWYDEMRKGDSRAQQLAVEYTADLLIYTGDLRQARALLQSSMSSDVAAGRTVAAARRHLLLAELALLDGDAKTAAAAATVAASLAGTPQVLFRAALILLDAGRVAEAMAVVNRLPQQLQGPDLWYGATAETERAVRQGDGDAIGRFESQLAGSRAIWLAHFRAGLLRLRSSDAAAAVAHLKWCLAHRPEAAAAYLDDVATLRYWSDAWYWSGVANETAGNRAAARADFASFLAPRANAHDARTADVRRRVHALAP